jgi:hypothetical protein
LTSSRNKQLRLHRQRLGQLQPLAHGQCQRCRGLVGLCVEANECEMRAGGLARRFQALARLREQSGGSDIVERRKFRKGLHDLEGARQAEPRGLIGLDPRDVTAIEGDNARR